MLLNDAQRRAVERVGQDVCVEAGPGSGKTRVLIERFRWLVDNGVPPDRILAFTFTEKAAAEIKTRLAKAFEDRPDLRATVERAWVSTVHGFCARMLRENAIEAGIDPEFAVIEELQSFDLLRESADEALEAVYAEDPARMRLLLESMDTASGAGQRRPDLAKSLLDIYDEMRTAGAGIDHLINRQAPSDPEFALRKLILDANALASRLPVSSAAQRSRVEQLRSWVASAKPLPATPLDAIRFLESFDCDAKGLRAPFSTEVKEFRDERIPAVLSQYAALYYAPLHELLASALLLLDRIYRDKKRSRAGLDFSDLEEHTIALLEASPEVCERARQGFEHILMDELQDTNPLQWRLVNLLRTPGCFFGVGDINQSIFGFRHATPEVFREYRADLTEQHLAIDTLRQNYRSVPEILDAVNSIFRSTAGVEAHTLTTECEPGAEAAVELRVARAETIDEGLEIEAGWAVRRILELNRSHAFGEMAVLLRTLNALEPLRRALNEARVPFVVTGARSFFESREVLDLIQLLRVLDNPLDEVSLAGVLRSPLVGVRDETIYRLKQAGALYESILRLAARDIPDDDMERLLAFRQRLRRALSERDSVAPDRLLVRAMDEAGYETRSSSGARASISRFLHLVRSARHNRTSSIADLLDQIDAYRENESEIEVASDQALNAVHIMSVHRSKGLEFPVVFLPFLQRWPVSSKPPICFSPESGLAVRWRSPLSERPIPEPVHSAICENLKLREQEEENRLLYVALTRAEKQLILSYSESRQSARGWAATVAGGLPPSVGKETVTVMPELGASLDIAAPDPIPDLVEPPALPEQHDFVVTATSLAEFQSCPRRYFLGRYLGWHTSRPYPPTEDTEPPDEERVEASEFGRQVHQALAGSAPAGIDPAALELCRVFTSSDLGRRAARATQAEREYEFVTAFGEIVVRGQIDLWFEEAGELVLVDYKTDHFHPSSDAGRVESYALQLRIYALALQRLTGRLPDRAVLAFLRGGHWVEVDLSTDRLEVAEAVVPRLAAAQQNLDFPLREGKQCLRCEFYGKSCPAIVSDPRPSYAAVQP